MIKIPHYSEAFAANGTTGGIIQVVASRAFWPGAVGYVSGDNQPGLKVIVLDMTDTTHIRVKLHPDEGISGDNRTVGAVSICDLSAYTVDLNSRITIPEQVIWQMPDGGVTPKLPTFWTT
jgi:hypothetical protein